MKLFIGNAEKFLDSREPPACAKVNANFDDLALALYTGIALIASFAVAWHLLTNTRPTFWLDSAWTSILLGISFTILHELLHLLAIPAALRRSTIVGFYPQRLGAFVLIKGRLSRARSIAVALVPFMLLTVIPFVVLVSFQINYKPAVFVMLWNAFASCIDVLLVIALLRDTPSNCSIIWGHKDLYYCLDKVASTAHVSYKSV